jgi:NAD(P)-dependent dehydrogenase (short-subunit alcohol dehydrogenase family)
VSVTGHWIDLSGRVALVTGAAAGIGRATAAAIARAGATTVLLDRDEAGVADVATQIAQDGFNAVGRVLDVASAADWAALADWIAAEFGRIDILVNCAGIARFDRVDAEMFATYRAVFAVNVEGPLRGMALALDYMRPAGCGAIVNVSSTAALKGNPAMASYGASKAAIAHFTRSAALETNRAGLDIRINAVLPGFTETGMAQQVYEKFDDRLGGRAETLRVFASGRPAQPSEIADLILFLVSDRASFISGSCYNIDRAQSA